MRARRRGGARAGAAVACVRACGGARDARAARGAGYVQRLMITPKRRGCEPLHRRLRRDIALLYIALRRTDVAEGQQQGRQPNFVFFLGDVRV